MTSQSRRLGQHSFDRSADRMFGGVSILSLRIGDSILIKQPVPSKPSAPLKVVSKDQR